MRLTILYLAVLLAACAHEKPKTECTSAQCGAAAECVPEPAGKEPGLGNQPEYSVCIPSAPTNTDATCAQYAAGLRDKAGLEAVKICKDEIGVECVSQHAGMAHDAVHDA